MHDAHAILETLAMVLCMAAVTTVLFHRFRQPVVLGYLLAGMIVGPNVPVPLHADRPTVQTLAELGVILLMFSLGIEFSLSKLLRVGATAGFVAVVQCSLMLWLGYVAGQAFGWSRLASVYAGAVIAISSTTIIVKAFEEQSIKDAFTHIVFAVLIVEDLIAILLITILTAVSHGTELTTLELMRTGGRLVAFLTLLVVIGLLTVPRLIRAIVRLGRTETIVVTSVGLAFGFALLASAFGYSVALGSFLAGSLLAESGVEKEVEHLVQPVRDIFAAIFFVSVGMLIDPRDIATNWFVVLVFLALVVVGKVASVTLGAFLTGESIQTSLKTGMSLAQIGEFSFIIAALGVATGASDPLLYSLAVAVSSITTLLTPWLIRAAGPTAAWVDRKLPRALQTFAALYGTWLAQLKAGDPARESNPLRGRVRWLAVDAIVLAAIVIGASVELDLIIVLAQQKLKAPAAWTRPAVVAGAALLSLPFAFGLTRSARSIGFELATRVFPVAGGKQLDLSAAPRRLLVVTLQLAIVLLVGVPLVAVTQPFLPPFRGAVVLLLVLALLAIGFWRGATNFQGHTRAAVQALAEMLSREAKKGHQAVATGRPEQVQQMLAGLGSPASVALLSGAAVVGKSLAETNLRGLTGATVLAIRRGRDVVVVPSGSERLHQGDVLEIAGTGQAVAAAQRLLSQKP